MIKFQFIKYLTFLISTIISLISLWVLSIPLLLVLFYAVQVSVTEMRWIDYGTANILNYFVFLLPILFALYKFIKTSFMSIEDLISDELIQAGEKITKLNSSVSPNDYISKNILDVVNDVKRKLNCKKEITVYRVHSNIFNAFAMSNLKNESAIVIYDGVANNDYNQLKSVIGHEVGHINNNDSLLKLLYFATQNSIPLFQYASTVVMNFLQTTLAKTPILNIIVMLYAIMYRILTFLVSLILKINQYLQIFGFKQAEFIADINGAKASSSTVMIQTLKNIKLIEDSQNNNEPSLLMILLSEHPPTEKRIRELQKGMQYV